MAEWQNRIIGEGEENPEQLLANPENWRIHPKLQQDVLTDVLDEVGWVQRVIVNRTTGHMVDGHLRAQLAISRGEPSIPVTYVELTVEEERKILATLDPLAAMAATDEEKRQELLAQVNAEGEALSAWIGGMIDPPELLGDPDEIPDVPAKPITKLGDRWRLGDHHLLCADSTDAAVLQRLMGGTPARLVATDPPYGVDYDGGDTSPRKRLANDDSDIYPALLAALDVVLDPKAPLYLFFAGVRALSTTQAVDDAGWTVRALLIWNKIHAHYGALGAQYKHRFEPFLYCHRKAAPYWYGPTNETSVWDIPQPNRNELHPTQKPVELFQRILTNSSQPGDAVLDPFGGSGTSLVAAEQSGRAAYLVEIDPAYCDVIVARWEGLTGKKAKRSRT